MTSLHLLLLVLAAASAASAATPPLIALPSGQWALSTIDASDKNAGRSNEAANADRGYLHYMSTATNKGAHLLQAAASIRAVNVTAAAAIQSAAALPADQQASAGQADMFTSNMGAYLKYHGGAMMVAPSVLNIYVLWYGNWTRKQKHIIRTFIQSLDKDASPAAAAKGKGKKKSQPATVVGWWGITVKYYTNAENKTSTPYVRLAKELVDDYSLAPVGSVVNPMTHDHVSKLLARATDPKRRAHFPADPKAAYLVLTSADVHVTDFCKGLCAFHTSGMFQGKRLAYMFVGNPSTQCPRYCTYQYFDPSYQGSNGDLGADAVADKIGHELSELVTNPFHGPKDKAGWVVAQSQVENADLCEWRYGPTQYSGKGRIWNVRGLNKTRFLLQLNFNVEKKECALQGDGTVIPAFIMSPGRR
eukprot:TRINITY_DN6036_c0_g1_i1.p1 TRINITY_DN6036_c0_g1~~TRINITY_DN6036_c0_g1_i1.p1  ORF type:complete len:418 (-),score=11.81 TRINITY_DN6036_c0_g1_i1:229-1482(-)